jgi:hypothetical protein
MEPVQRNLEGPGRVWAGETEVDVSRTGRADARLMTPKGQTA